MTGNDHLPTQTHCLARIAGWLVTLLCIGVGAASADPAGATDFYLHRTSSEATPPGTMLVLDHTPPTATTVQSQTSAILTFEGGNPWQEVGTWTAAAAGSAQTLTALGDLRLWVGPKLVRGWMKGEGPRFDLRAEAYRNDTLVTSGETRCIEGMTRNPAGIRQVTVPFEPFAATPFMATDVLSLRILARVGTDAAGAFCGGRSSALGARLYFDAVHQPSGFAAMLEPAISGPDTDGDGIPDGVDCSPTLADQHVVDPLGAVPAAFTGGRHATLQAAASAALDDQVISMYADTTENVVIGDSTGSGGVDLRIVGCGRKVMAADPGLPVIHLESTAGANDGDRGSGERDVHIEDLSVRQAHQVAGYLVETGMSVSGTDALLKAVGSENNGLGIRVVGDGNEIRGAKGVKFNAGHGIQVVGDNNLIRENDLSENGEDGINVTGDHNLIEKNDVGDAGKGNAGHGVHVVGAGNLIAENNVLANGGHGIEVSGGSATGPNLLKKNDVGDRHKGNGGHGIFVHDDSGSGTPDVVALAENRVRGNGLTGITVAGGGHALEKNDSGGTGDGGDNGGCEFDVAAGNFNATGNTANSETVLPDTDGMPFPTGCLGTP